MLGAMLGAAYGVRWIPARWYCMLENGVWGRDYAIELGRRLSRLDSVVVLETNRAFADRPLHSLIAAALAMICAHFRKTDKELVDWYNPERMLLLPETEKLWLDLFDALQLDGTVRFDIATSLVAFFSESKCAAPASSLSREEWTRKYKEFL